MFIWKRQIHPIGVLALTLWLTVGWVILTGKNSINSVNFKHFIALVVMATWVSWLSLYYWGNTHIVAFSHQSFILLGTVLKPIRYFFENLAHKFRLGILFGLWLGYIALNFILERRIEPRNFNSEGYITDFSFWQVFTVANRPVTVPLFYKLLGNDLYRIEIMQYVVSVICWTILALAIQYSLQTRLLKFVAWLVILLFSINRELFFWHSMLLSESLSHSLLAAGLGFGILTVEYIRQHANHLTRRRQLYLAMGLTTWLFFWSMTRDANSYVVLSLAGLLILFIISQQLCQQQMFILPIVMVLSCLIIFAGQTLQSERGKRWHIPYINILGERILTDEHKTAYFVERGLPQNEQVSQYAGQRAWAFQPEHDIRYEINDWLNSKGRTVYLEYLLTHPAQTFSAPLTHWQQLLGYHYSLAFLGYMESDTDVPHWLNAYSCAVYWDDIAICGVIRAPNSQYRFSAFFPLLMTTNAVVFVLITWQSYGWDNRQIYSLAMLFFMYVLGFVAWHGDADSIERHAVQANILWRLSLWFAVIFAADWMLHHQSIIKQSK